MTQQTSKGITYPESTDHARLWEHLQTLASSADGAIPGSVDVQVFTSSGTWTRPAGAIWVMVEVQAGGGGSGGVTSTTASTAGCSPGGAGGEYARGTFTAAAAGASQAVTVGAGGAGGAAGANPGSPGGSSSFGSLITCQGGGGGLAGTTTTGSVGISGPDGGSGGTGGDFRVQGADGGAGQVITLQPVKVNYGGGSFLGQSRRTTGIVQASSSGLNGHTYGGGAAGASNGAQVNPAVAGGTGGAGIVIVTTIKA